MRIGARMMVLFIAIAWSCVAGCNRSDRYSKLGLVPLSGKVTLDGQPVAKVGLTFIPVGSTQGQPCYAFTDENGQYAAEAATDRKGVPAGEFKVVCSKWVMPNGSEPPRQEGVPPWEQGAKELFPTCYSSEDRTQLKITVPAGGNTAQDFQLKKKPGGKA